MSRRTVTIDAKLDGIINFVRGAFLLVGQEYNYTEVVNHAIFYGICYWLGVSHAEAVKLAPQFLGTNLKVEGMRDEQIDQLKQQFFSKPQP
jgi:uncharacterized membrane protein YjdF